MRHMRNSKLLFKNKEETKNGRIKTYWKLPGDWNQTYD